MRYLVRDRMFAFHEEAWIESEHREKLFRVNKKLFRLRTTFAFLDGQPVMAHRGSAAGRRHQLRGLQRCRPRGDRTGCGAENECARRPCARARLPTG